MSKKTKRKTDLKVQNSSTKVLFVSKQLVENSQDDLLEIIPVQLPRKKATILKSKDGSLYELLEFKENFRSWFLNEFVISNGKIYIATKIDPLFIFLQYIEEHCKTRAQPLSQIDSLEFFIDSFKVEQMRLVADQKGPDDMKAFIWNETKTYKWLKKKFVLVKDSLKAQNIITSGASSMNFVKSSTEVSVDEDTIDEAALGIISEYISLEMKEKLDQSLGISAKISSLNQKRKSENVHEIDSKRIKMEEQENLLISNGLKNPPKVTTKTKAFEKAAKGSKSISSFFTKK